jgi:hypothetical protein
MHQNVSENLQVEGDVEIEETPVLGFASGFFWLAGMTVLISILSEYVVGTIEVYTSHPQFALISSVHPPRTIVNYTN